MTIKCVHNVQGKKIHCDIFFIFFNFCHDIKKKQDNNSEENLLHSINLDGFDCAKSCTRKQ